MLTSKEILEKEDLYDLQTSFCSLGIPFKYKLTEGEIGWLGFVKGRYSIADFILENTDENMVLTFEDAETMSKALADDDIPHKAVMLSDDTALQRLFFWLSTND